MFCFQLFFFFQFIQLFEGSRLLQGVVFNFTSIFGCRKPERVTLLFWFFRSEEFIQLSSQVRVTFGVILRIAVSTGWMNLASSWMNMEDSATSVFRLIKWGVSVVLVTLTATFLSIIVEIEWEIISVAVSVNFSNGVMVAFVFQSEGCST